MMLGEWFREEGLQQGIQQGTNNEIIVSVTSLMDSLKIPLEEAMSLLHYSEEKKKLCKELLSMKE